MNLNVSEQDLMFLQKAIELSRKGMQGGHGGPFGCVIVKDGKIIGEGYNQVTSSNDPTAHAEVVAIRKACEHLGTWQLENCDVYASCEPCPMCLGAIYWARPRRVVYANTRQDAAAVEFDDDFIYREISAPVTERKIPFICCAMPEAKAVFEEWKALGGKIKY